MSQINCNPCNSTDLTACDQHLFLGCSIQNFDVSLGWNTTQSTLKVSLKEDNCINNKVCYDLCLQAQTQIIEDPGFFGLPRYQRTDGSQYSSSVQENASDVLVRQNVLLPGSPAFFRACDFEWCGIVQSWSHTKSTTGGNTYYVELVDPRIILDKVSLIIGEYGGYVNQIGGSGCPPGNLINVYAYLEQYGLPCLPFVQCSDGVTCGGGLYAGAGTCPTVDGTVFGSPNGGFAGSGWNEEGMTIGNILGGLDILVNSIPTNSNILQFSPYGRICYCTQDVSPVGTNGCGLMQPEVSADPCMNGKHFYYFDFTELYSFVPTNYRIQGPVITVGELINQLSTTFGFDYYVDMIPFQNGVFGTCIDKLIKLRCVNRNVAPNIGEITQFIESNLDCVGDYTTGVELRSENGGKYLIGDFKQTVYQAYQNDNPDANFLGAVTDTNTMACLNSDTGGTQLITYTPRETTRGDIQNPCKPFKNKNDASGSETAGPLTEQAFLNIAEMINVPGYPFIDGATLCPEIDDMIIPFFGENSNGNYLIPCKDADGNWFFDAPIWELQSQLLYLNTQGRTTLRISEKEMRAALSGFEQWQTFVKSFNTETGQLLPADVRPNRDLTQGLSSLSTANNVLARDSLNPHLGKFSSNTDSRGQRIQRDKQSIYDWVNRYATEFYGKKFAVRVPFTCCALDPDTLKIRVSDLPNNDGGWTEQPCVLDLPNNPFGFGAFEFLNFFRTDDGRIKPFVRFTKGVLKEVSSLGKDDYFYYYNIPPATLANFETGTGPPGGAPGTSSAYIDTDSGTVYSYNHDEGIWVELTSACSVADSGPPGTTGWDLDCINLYVDTDTCDVYINTDPTPSGPDAEGKWTVDGGSWEQIDIYLYLKAEIREEFTFYDKSTCCCPRVIVELPQAISLRDIRMDNIAGLTESFTSLANYSSGCTVAITDNQVITAFTHGVAGADSWVGFYNAACMPEAVAFPMKSSVTTYGPWTDPATDCGLTEAVQDPEFVPWNFGGYTNMNAAADALVQAARTDLKIGEIGNICVPGAPDQPLGAELGAVAGGFYGGGTHLIENRTLTQTSGTNPSGGGTNVGSYNLGAWGGVFGPNITNISVNFNCAGGNSVQTCYSMRTFSPPRREGVARWMIDQFRQSRGRLDLQIKYVRTLIEESKRQRLSRALAARDDDKRWEMRGDIPNKSNAGEVTVAQMKKTSGKKTGRTNVSSMNMQQVSDEMQNQYSEKAFMSMDGHWRPFSLDGDGGITQLARYKLREDNTNASGILSISGFKEAENNSTKIKQDDLLFLTNPSINILDVSGNVVGSELTRDWVASQRSDTPEIGHDIDIIGRTGKLNGTPHAGLIMPNNLDDSGNATRDYTNDYRGLAIRGPVMITAWSYDCDDRPIPNKNDTYENASQGIFKHPDESGAGPSGTMLDDDKFLDCHLQKPETWPTGPLDIRFNRDRGVWESWACNAGGSTFNTREGCVSGDPIPPGECANYDCITIMTGNPKVDNSGGGLRLNKLETPRNPVFVSGVMTSSGGVDTEIQLGIEGFTGAIRYVTGMVCDPCEVTLTSKLLHVNCGIVTHTEDAPDIPTGCQLPAGECPTDCSGCPDGLTLTIPLGTFDCDTLSCLNGAAVVFTKGGNELNVSGCLVSGIGNELCQWFNRPNKDGQGHLGTDVWYGPFDCCQEVVATSEITDIETYENNACDCECSGGIFIHTPLEPKCRNGAVFNAEHNVITGGKTCWACSPSFPPGVGALGDQCLENCPLGLCQEEPTIDLKCESGVWKLTLTIGTAGVCPFVSVSFSAEKAALFQVPGCFNPNEGCPDLGNWEGIWSVGSFCPDTFLWDTDIQCDDDVFVGHVVLGAIACTTSG